MIFSGLALIACAVVIYQIPAVNRRLSWRLDAMSIELRRQFNPVGAFPTAADPGAVDLPAPVVRTTSLAPASPQAQTAATEDVPQPTAAPTATLLPTPTPTAIPQRVILTPAERRATDSQDWNNCGPATLALYLRYYGWEGDQYTISDVIKPIRADRNVNVDDLTYYVLQNVPDLKANYRVGGSLVMIKQFIAAGIPVVIEESFVLEEGAQGIAGPDDDRWTGHYLLVTGYDDALKSFITQDSYRGANQAVPYVDLDSNWQAFNRAFIYVYRPEQEQAVFSILADNLDAETNRYHALDTARQETVSDPDNAFAWFNLGSNLVYFEDYQSAARAYDKARSLGLPQRMLRYQFGPFLAYFHSGRTEDLAALADYALKVTPNSEEALLWKGWALYRQGKSEDALESFRNALEARPGYSDAEYAINFVLQN